MLTNPVKYAVALVILIALVVFAYWPIVTMQDSLKWDMLDSFFPWRSFVADCAKNRVFPNWNPYQHLGYPIFADLRSIFYPEPWIIGLLGGYSMRWMHGLFVFYLTLAGLGMFKLSERFTPNAHAGMTVASAYVLSGFFVGHGQDMAAYISGAWMPWSLNYFIQLQEKPNWVSAWKLVFFTFLHFTGGYHALNIVFIYLLISIAVAFFIKRLLSKEIKVATRQLLINASAGVLSLITIAGLLVAYKQGAEHVGRLGGLSLKQVCVGLLAPQSLTSLLTPYGVTTLDNLSETDVTMQNVYVGLLMLIFFCVGLFSRKCLTQWVLLAFGLLCLFASLGPHTPVREFLYRYVPGMNLFRMSSFFAYFWQVAVLVTAGVGIEMVFTKPSAKPFKRSFYFILILTLTIGIIAYTTWPTASVFALRNVMNLEAVQQGFSFSQRLVIHSAIQLLILLAFWVLFRNTKWNSKPFWVGIFLLTTAEMGISTKLNYSTTIGGGHSPRELQAYIDKLPDGFPLPDITTELKWHTDATPDLGPLYHNTNILAKTISSDGYNSFQLQRFEDLTDNLKEVFMKALRRPATYAKGDSTIIRLKSFVPNEFVFNVQTAESDSITLQQMYFPGWIASVNGEVKDIQLANGNFPTVDIPQGQSVVSFAFKNPTLNKAMLVSLITLLIIIGLSVGFSLGFAGYSRMSSALFGFGLPLLVAVGSWLLYSHTEPSKNYKISNYLKLCSKIREANLDSKCSIVLQVDDSSLMDSLLKTMDIENPVIYAWDAGGEQLAKLSRLDSVATKSVLHVGWNEPPNPYVTELLSTTWPVTEVTDSDVGFAIMHSKGRSAKAIFKSSNDFERPNERWSYRDTATATMTNTFQGNYSWQISSGSLGSPAIKITGKELGLIDDLRFVFRTQCLIPESDVGLANLYIIIQRRGETVWETAKGLNEMAKGSRDWFPAMLIATPSLSIQAGDVIKAFVWGSEGKALYLDNMSFSVYGSQSKMLLSDNVVRPPFTF